MASSEAIATAVSSFREAAIAKDARGVLPAAEDHALHRQMASAVRALDQLGSAGAAALRGLSHDSSPAVRSWAATELLCRGESAMEATLEAIAAEPGMLGFSARMVIQEYRAGRLKSPFSGAAP